MVLHPLNQIFRQRHFALVIALLVLFVAVFLGLSNYLQRSARSIDRSEQILFHTQRLQALLSDQESGLRGYLLTGELAFLAPYSAAASALDPQFDTLADLAEDDPTQLVILSDLHRLARDWQQYAQTMIMLRAGSGSYQDGAMQQEGRQRMEAMRARLQILIANQTSLRNRRSAIAARTIPILVGTSLTLSLLIGCGLTISSQHKFRELGKPPHQTLADTQASMEQFQGLFMHAPVGIFLVRDGSITMTNPTATAMFGYTDTAQLIDMPASLLLTHPDTPTSELAAHDTGLRQNGSSFPLRIHEATLSTSSGKTTALYLTDITIQKRLEAQVLQMQKMESIGRLAGGVAHDFNNLLTALSGYNELARGALDIDHPVQVDLDDMQKVIDRAATLTRQLLAFARKQPIATEVVDLNHLIGNMDSLLQRLLGDDIDLRTVASPTLGRIKVDPGQIEQVLLNLAVNARDAMPVGGQLTIETANVELDTSYVQQQLQVLPGSYVLLAVSDTGVGMTPEVQARLFEPFFTTKDVEHGTGLGLATSYGIIAQHGGHIWVYSELGRGTTFKVYLPRLSDPAAEPPAALTYAATPGGSETVLLVEDDRAVLLLAAQVLVGAGYQVLQATQSDAALSLAREHSAPLDLLLTDIMLPGIDGVTLAVQLRTLHPNMKTLFISGYADQALLHQGRLAHDMRLLPKPFATTTLLQMVRDVLDTND